MYQALKTPLQQPDRLIYEMAREINKREKKLDRLVKYVHKYIFPHAGKTEVFANGSDLPTIRHLARHFRVKQADMLDMVDDDDRLDYNIGIKTRNGIYVHEKIGDYTIEIDMELVERENDRRKEHE